MQAGNRLNWSKQRTTTNKSTWPIFCKKSFFFKFGLWTKLEGWTLRRIGIEKKVLIFYLEKWPIQKSSKMTSTEEVQNDQYRRVPKWPVQKSSSLLQPMSLRSVRPMGLSIGPAKTSKRTRARENGDWSLRQKSLQQKP